MSNRRFDTRGFISETLAEWLLRQGILLSFFICCLRITSSFLFAWPSPYEPLAQLKHR